jgi:hypothetical protein
MPVTKGSGNPKWTRDETILALDLYMRLGKVPGPKNADIIALSELLNRMPWHSKENRNGTFRNPDGVSLKLLNMRSFERGYAGRQSRCSRCCRSRRVARVQRGYIKRCYVGTVGAHFGHDKDFHPFFPA